jgi:hypothetical protein
MKKAGEVDDSGKHVIKKEKLVRYLDLTGKALKLCSEAIDESRNSQAKDFLDMAQRYYSDSGYFMKKDDYVLAFAAINYAHGWLDAGARIGLFKVKDSTLFTVDD